MSVVVCAVEIGPVNFNRAQSKIIATDLVDRVTCITINVQIKMQDTKRKKLQRLKFMSQTSIHLLRISSPEGFCSGNAPGLTNKWPERGTP